MKGTSGYGGEDGQSADDGRSTEGGFLFGDWERNRSF